MVKFIHISCLYFYFYTIQDLVKFLYSLISYEGFLYIPIFAISCEGAEKFVSQEQFFGLKKIVIFV